MTGSSDEDDAFSDHRKVVAALIHGAWITARLVDKRPYPEAWRSGAFIYVVEFERQRFTLQSWEVRERTALDPRGAVTLQVARPRRK